MSNSFKASGLPSLAGSAYCLACAKTEAERNTMQRQLEQMAEILDGARIHGEGLEEKILELEGQVLTLEDELRCARDS